MISGVSTGSGVWLDSTRKKTEICTWNCINISIFKGKLFHLRSQAGAGSEIQGAGSKFLFFHFKIPSIG